MSLNHAVICGRVATDLTLKETQSGVPFCSFRLAVDRDYKNKETGERGVDFLDVISWRGTAQFICSYFEKGRSMIVDGRLEVNEYQDKDGNNRRNAQVVANNVYFADSKRSDSNTPKSEPSYTPLTSDEDGFKEIQDESGYLPF